LIWWHAIVIVVAGFWAGTINTVVGSGTLVTFPTLLALGYPPVTATTSNAIGLAPGSVTGAIGYRHELRGLRSRLLRYATASALGAGCGTVLLLGLPRDAFATVVPFLIVLALVLVLVQPKVSRWVANRNPDSAAGGGALLLFFVFLIGVYGGYFSAAQGVLLMGVLGILLAEPLQRLNGIKNVLASTVNVLAGTVYAFVAPVDWAVIGLLALGAIAGGMVGAKIGRKLPPTVLRGVIIIIGAAAVVGMLLR